MKRMPIGVDDFKKVVEDYYYVDKTLFIKELLDNHGDVTLITRPRRFGKTIAMSMLSYFFSISQKENASLFDHLAIASVDDGGYLKERNRYPVIFLTMKDVQNDTWAMLYDAFRLAISAEYNKHLYLLEGETLSDYEKLFFRKILTGEASPAEYQVSIAYLSDYLARYFHEKPIILIDEYDAPLQYAYQCGFYQEAISYFRTWYNKMLKGNASMNFAVLTGVLRVAKESIFSGLNNLEVDSALADRYSDTFGFTLEDIETICRDYHAEASLAEVKAWYDGYRFGNQDIYNPWSVINFFKNHGKAMPYWVNTSDNRIVKYMLAGTDSRRLRQLEQLLEGKTVEATLHESVIYDDIKEDRSALLTMLLTTGYLTIAGKSKDIYNRYFLKIPNEEIKQLYHSEIMSHISQGHTSSEFDDLFSALLSGDKETFSSLLAQIIRRTVSIYDAANKECFYHGFLLGMMACFGHPNYAIRSNRESGFGRFDLAIFPKDKTRPGVVMEFKYARRKEDLSKEAAAAIRQIQDRAYTAELESEGVEKVWLYGIAFHGKEICVERISG